MITGDLATTGAAAAAGVVNTIKLNSVIMMENDSMGLLQSFQPHGKYFYDFLCPVQIKILIAHSLNEVEIKIYWSRN